MTALILLLTSFLIRVKLHQQLSIMIEGRIYREYLQNWPVGVYAKYRPSHKELMLHIASSSLLGITVGLMVYLEQQLLLPLIFGALTLVTFYIHLREIIRNFRIEEERNRAVFEDRKPR